MKKFVQLLTELESTSNVSESKVALLRYFNRATEQDLLWTVSLLLQRRPRRIATTQDIRSWAWELADLPEWLLEYSQTAVGDVAETCALIISQTVPDQSDESLSFWMDEMLSLYKEKGDEKKLRVLKMWQQLSSAERFWMNKLLTGTFRFTVSAATLVKALSDFTGKEASVIAYRLTSGWSVQGEPFEQIFLQDQAIDVLLKPFDFAEMLDWSDEIAMENAATNWKAEWHWEGLPVQLIFRGGELFLWSEEGVFVSEKFPEFAVLKNLLPDGTVISGRLVVLNDGTIQNQQLLVQRLSRKKVSSSLLAEFPVVLIANDLLEFEGEDWRKVVLEKRWQQLEMLLEQIESQSILLLAETVSFSDWQEIEQHLQQGRESHSGVLLLREGGNWYGEKMYKKEAAPLRIKAVLLYAQRDDRNADRLSELTFAVWKNEELVPVAKAVINVEDEDYEAIKDFVKANTIERFGPVSSVLPQLVFEIVFTDILPSKRHKSGLKLVAPALESWQKELTPEEAHSLAYLHDFLIRFGKI